MRVHARAHEGGSAGCMRWRYGSMGFLISRSKVSMSLGILPQPHHMDVLPCWDLMYNAACPIGYSFYSEINPREKRSIALLPLRRQYLKGTSAVVRIAAHHMEHPISPPQYHAQSTQCASKSSGGLTFVRNRINLSSTARIQARFLSRYPIPFSHPPCTSHTFSYLSPSWAIPTPSKSQPLSNGSNTRPKPMQSRTSTMVPRPLHSPPAA
jgi:hypothetical protein